MNRKHIIGAVAAFAGIAVSASIVTAQQPALDTLDIDEFGCVITVEWNDGTDDTEQIEVYVDGARVYNFVWDDEIGDRSRDVVTFTAAEGAEIEAVLTANGGETTYTVDEIAGPCPTPTATPRPPTATPTPVPPTATATPQPPVEIIRERVVEVPVLVFPTATPVPQQPLTILRPPSTGGAGLAAPADWSWGGGSCCGNSGGFYQYFGWW